jgi:hypothetical protein
MGMTTYSAATLADLARSGLDADDAATMQIRELGTKDVRRLTGGQFECSGYLIPYFDSKDQPTDFWRIRFHKEQKDSDGKLRRYTQAKGSGVHVYFPRTCRIASDPANPPRIVITEGEKKAVAACKAGIPCVALGGVDSFRSRKLRISLLPALRALAPGVRVEITYDGTDNSNPNVRRAAVALAAEMTDAGTRDVQIVELPPDSKLDDFLLAHGVEEYENLPRHAYTVLDRCEAVRVGQTMLSARERHKKIYSLIRADWREHCTLHVVSCGDVDRLYLFDKRNSELYDFDDPRNGPLTARMNALYGTNSSETEWSWLHAELCAYIRRKGQRSVVHRFAARGSKSGALYIYAGEQEVFRITSDDWSRVRNGYGGMLFLNRKMISVTVADKASREAMEELLMVPRFVSVPEMKAAQMRMLYELWIWSLFFPHLHPTRCFLLLYGVAGSRKTSALKALVFALFGTQDDVVNFDDAKAVSAITTVLLNNHLSALDNIDGKHPGIENLLATAATGGYYTERLLYANGKEFRAKLDTYIAVTSRDPQPFRRSDLVDRLLLTKLDRGGAFRSERGVQTQATKNRPRFWRYVLDTLPAMLRALGRYREEPVPYRMADFVNFCLAVGPVLGYSEKRVMDAFEAQQKYKASFELEASTLPEALRDVLEQSEVVGMEARQLLKFLQNKDPQFPYRSAVSLGNALRHQQEGLRQHGILCNHRKGRGNRTLYNLKLLAATKTEDREKRK